MDKELQLLKRPIERLIDKFTYFLLKKFTNTYVLTMNQNIFTPTRIQKNKVIYIQNGYNTTKPSLKP